MQPPVDPSSTQNLINLILDAAQNKHWQLLAALILVGAVALVRWLAPKVHGRLGAWLNTDRGATLLVLLGGVTGAVATALMAGQRLSLRLIAGGVTTGVMASGGWNVVKKLFWPSDKPIVVTMPEAAASPASPAAPTPPAKPSGGAAKALLPVLFVGLLGTSLAGCQCWQAAHQQDIGCIVVHQVIDCTQGDSAGAISAVASVIAGLIAGQPTVDWSAVYSGLISAGVKDAGCILAALENDFAKKTKGMGGGMGVAPTMTDKAVGAHDLLARFKNEHGLKGVRFKLADGSLH